MSERLIIVWNRHMHKSVRARLILSTNHRISISCSERGGKFYIRLIGYVNDAAILKRTTSLFELIDIN